MLIHISHIHLHSTYILLCQLLYGTLSQFRGRCFWRTREHFVRTRRQLRDPLFYPGPKVKYRDMDRHLNKGVVRLGFASVVGLWSQRAPRNALFRDPPSSEPRFCAGEPLSLIMGKQFLAASALVMDLCVYVELTPDQIRNEFSTFN